MPSILVINTVPVARKSEASPLPQLLETPEGTAIIEIQGTLNMFEPADEERDAATRPIGRLVIAQDGQNDEKAWTDRVYLYVGKHQRLLGEVKKLQRPYGIVRKKEVAGVTETTNAVEQLEVFDLVKWKIFFGGRPEFV